MKKLGFSRAKRAEIALAEAHEKIVVLNRQIAERDDRLAAQRDFIRELQFAARPFVNAVLPVEGETYLDMSGLTTEHWTDLVHTFTAH